MIVTSKRCFLNVLTQICNADTLLNANYYMADIRTPDGSVNLSDSLRYNDYGQLVVDSSMTKKAPVSLGGYNIRYGSGELDPSPFVANILVGIGDTHVDSMDRFLHHLNSTDTMIATYNFLFRNELRGNGLQILIFSDENTVAEYVHIVCGYLAQNFGQDITFIDPQYRPNVKGQVQYVGDKAYAQRHIQDIRDAQLIMDFNQALSCYGDSMSNLITFLSGFGPVEIMHLYNLLFPDAPLPPDNYTTDHVKQIIIGRVASSKPANPFDNILVENDFMSLIEQYESEQDGEEEDFSSVY